MAKVAQMKGCFTWFKRQGRAFGGLSWSLAAGHDDRVLLVVRVDPPSPFFAAIKP